MSNTMLDRLDWSRWDQDDFSELSALCRWLDIVDSSIDARVDWPEEVWEALANAKAPGWSLPPELGGEACHRSRLLTRYARVAGGSLTGAFILSQHDAGIRRLLASRDRPVAADWLARIAAGRAFVTVGISQLTTSRRHGAQALLAEANGEGGFVLNGVMPWVTGGERADVIVAGAVTPEGQQLLIALPTARAGVAVQAPFPLAALQSSRTAEIRCEQVQVEEAEILIGPAENVMNHPAAAGTGGLETSALALGQAHAAISMLVRETQTRSELNESAEALAGAWSKCWNDLIDASNEKSGAITSGRLRADANSLVLKATQAYLISRKGSGFVREEPAQRWARQALFFLVWSCPSPVAQSMIQDMAGVCSL